MGRYARRTTTLVGTLLLLAASAHAAVAPTYNAIQAGKTTEGSERARAYTGFTAEGKRFTLTHQGLTESDGSSLYGDHKFAFGLTGKPVSLVGDWRFDEHGVVERAFGLRLDLARVPGVDYGSFDLLKHDRVGQDGYGGMEGVAFIGHEFGSSAVELTQFLREGGDYYGELELLLPPRALKHGKIRPFARAEYDGHGFTGVAGIQLQGK